MLRTICHWHQQLFQCAQTHKQTKKWELELFSQHKCCLLHDRNSTIAKESWKKNSAFWLMIRWLITRYNKCQNWNSFQLMVHFLLLFTSMLISYDGQNRLQKWLSFIWKLKCFIIVLIQLVAIYKIKQLFHFPELASSEFFFMTLSIRANIQASIIFISILFKFNETSNIQWPY